MEAHEIPITDLVKHSPDIKWLMAELRSREPAFAKLLGKEDYIDCDEMATILSRVLTAWEIDHQSMLGTSDEGSSHAWIRVHGMDLDPTDQGCNNGEVIENRCFDPEKRKDYLKWLHGEGEYSEERKIR